MWRNKVDHEWPDVFSMGTPLKKPGGWNPLKKKGNHASNFFHFCGGSCSLFVFFGGYFWGKSYFLITFAHGMFLARENLRLHALLSDGYGAERQFWTPRVGYLHGTGLVYALCTCRGTGVGIGRVSTLFRRGELLP